MVLLSKRIKARNIVHCSKDTFLNVNEKEDIRKKFKKSQMYFDALQEWHGDPILVWSPVVEPEIQGVERFLPEQPADLFRKGKFHKVPLIAGVTKDEFGGVITSEAFIL